MTYLGTYTAQILALIICLILPAFFSMSETSLMLLGKIKIRHMINIFINDKEYFVDARLNIRNLSDRMVVEIQSEKFNSIDALIFREIGSLSKQRDKIVYSNIKFEFESVKENRINKVRVFL